LTDFLSDSSFLTRIKHWTGFDRAIAFTVLGRFWSAFVSLITVLLIARLLTPNEQGYYYTFFSLVAIQIVFELGFSFVVLQLAAHERTHLIFLPGGQIEGDAVAHSRIASVLQKSVRWYSVAAMLMAIALWPIGLHFFNTHNHAASGVPWRGPWCLLVLGAAFTFQIDPIFSFLEGCGFISQVARMRLFQNMLGAVLSWTAMLTHHGLYSPAMMILGQATVGAIFLFTPPHRQLLGNLLRYRVGEHFVGWRREIWPFQWRIALSWLCGYFIFQIFTPVLFAFQGPVSAGQMGMSLTVSSGIGSVAVAWMTTKSSPFGNLIARGKIAELDKTFFTTLRQSTILLLIAAATFFLLLVIGGPHFPKLAMRILPPRIFVLLLLTTLMNHIVLCEAIYLRAHKREPFLLVTVVSSILLTTSTLLLGRFLGANAVVAGYFAITAFYGLPYATHVFLKKRREWHSVPYQTERAFPEAIQ
jgi:hypothetical protein